MSDWAAIALQVATELLGEPNQRLSSQDELRWGTRGSFALKRSTGRWRDFEAGESGGAIQLVQRERSCDKTAALQWLRDRRLMPAEPAQHRPAPRRNPKPPPTSDLTSVAQRIWTNSQPIPDDPQHPARRWLDARNLWRPEVPVPDPLRWLPARSHVPGPHAGTGSIVAMLSTIADWQAGWPELPEPVAVQLIAINHQGGPTLDRPLDSPNGPGLSKRTLGAQHDTLLFLGNPVLDDATAPVRVAEGVADALALAARYAGPAVATIGSGGMTNPQLAQWMIAAPVGSVIHADDDDAGRRAASRLRSKIIEAGGQTKAQLARGVKDAGDAARLSAFGNPPADWEYADTLAEMYRWPRWECRRLQTIEQPKGRNDQ